MSEHKEWKPDSVWDHHSRYSVCDWQQEVADDDTRLGYIDWVNSHLDQEELE